MRAALILLPALLASACGGSQTAEGPAGPACATLTAEAFAARGVTLKQSAELNGALIERQFGSAACEANTSGRGGEGSSCALSSPGVVHVRFGGADAYFDIPVGRPATITTGGDQVRCVLTEEQNP